MKIDHIQLAIPAGGEGSARAFYCTVLGMEEERKPEPLKSRGGVWLRSRDTVVHLGVEADFVPQRKAHPCFLVRSLDAVAATLSAAGHPVRWDSAIANLRRFYTEDPFGNRIEFIADGDGFSQC